ncbi:translation initiation factor IF-2 [Limibacterium fermenti]|uniref:translation initiation factor IF-2 n=1 Tax=Limibacterium fermenti TaxID=3229863 RepID=UPI003A7710B4
MPIRLIKVSKNLNVGINSLVEFLHKKGVEIEANPNVKIEDDHYDMLIAEFGKDKKIRTEATETREKLHRKEDNRETVAIEGYELPEPALKKKTEKETIKTEIPNEMKPHLNVIGNIDLDNLNKKKSDVEDAPQSQPEPEVEEEKEKEEKKPAETPAEHSVEPTAAQVDAQEPERDEKTETIQNEQPTPEEIIPAPEKITEKPEIPQTPEPEPVKETIVPPAEEKKEEKKEEKAEELPSPDETPAAEPEKAEDSPVEKEATPAPEEKEEPQQEDNHKQEIELTEVEQPSQEKTEQKEPEEIFRIHQNKPEAKIVVKGTIDLNSINDKTRPPRKSKAQRKKERLEREQKELDNKKLRDEKVKLLKKEAIDENKKKGADEGDGADAKKKKRKRIRTGKVNIEKPGNLDASQRGGERKFLLKKPVRAEISDDDVQKQIKETLARLTEKKGGKGGAKYRREKRESMAQKHELEKNQREKESLILQLTEFVTANDLANLMNVPVTDIISTCMSLGVMVAINQRLDAETINIVAEEFGFKTKYVSADVIDVLDEEEDDAEDLKPRPPIVTVMGHVDHGKTSLLDNIRKTNVIAGEAGGITQHIGAYNVQLKDGRRITFLDTPGHEAFTAMRARGAKVTDVAIIIVAADDNVMPQTVEAINHAAAAGVPIVFAINKIDKPGANPDKIKERLAEMNYLVEEWGGKYQSQDISAKQGIGVEDLLEKVLLEADLLELHANPDRAAKGSIIESSLDKGRGYVATVLVENGTLRQGDILLAGAYFGRVKAMFNERNQRIEEAGPSAPALVLGLNGAPQAGDKFNVLESEQEARSIATRREQLQREQSIRTQKMLTLDDIGRRIAIGNFQQLNIIVKGDVDGSVEALSDSLIRLSTPQIEVNVIHKAVGQISESDISLAAASDAIIIGFQVRPSLNARKEAEKEGVDIRLYSIIYDAIEQVTAAMEGMLSPEIKEEITGNAEVLEVFKISKVGTVAGCMVRDGKIKRSNKVRLIRDGIVIFTGEFESLKRFKEDIKEVSSGYECGITIHNFNDIKVGDVVEAYEEIEVKKTL